MQEKQALLRHGYIFMDYNKTRIYYSLNTVIEEELGAFDEVEYMQMIRVSTAEEAE